MQASYFEALVNRRHRLLGRWLHDFCFYDALFLSLAGNPLWTGGGAPSLADLEEAALICSLPPERFLRADLEPRGLREHARRWRFEFRLVLAARLGRLLPWREAERAAFEDYIADFYAVPQFWDAAGGGRPIKAPWILSVASFLEAHSNMREREIMTAPIGKMLWKAEAIGERLGVNVCEIMTEEEIAIGAEQRAALAAEGLDDFPVPPPDYDDDQIPGL